MPQTSSDPQPLSWQIGVVTVTRVEERISPVSWNWLVPEAAALVEQSRPWVDPYVSEDGSKLHLSVHSFVVQTPETLMVIDTCVGTRERSLPGDPNFGERLAAALPGGPDAVDVVVCTHLHFDHVGWNTIERDGQMVPTFANARYLVSKGELEAQRDEEDSESYAESIAPLLAAGCLYAVDSDHQIDSWVSLEASPGHTPGHVSVRITDGDDVGLITGDIIHTPIQLAYPTVRSNSDIDPATAIATRQRVIEEVVDTDVLLLGTHFGPPTAGHLRRHTDGIRFE